MTRLFMEVTLEVMEIAPTILRIYAINTFLGTCLQSIMQAVSATWIALLRGLLLNCLLLYVLPLIWGGTGVWIAFVLAEWIVAVIGLVWMVKIKRLY